ncbi:hypothetical protein BN1058_02000 [Paraliobacillus sp. PM-2]|uniref:DUF342 domain-containing protein n=1 Tax=Paraliobacillus sp. PM-2 TaxID=1462524 RepID=UPI00061CC52A|nr:FapA family protein [Paraliobacillus sp. PM-2]CQR47673.1 hypothetical protein BN1058_02000 [Paraliobacillus sp. PM-2]
MESLHEIFKLTISKDKMSATLDRKQDYQEDLLNEQLLLSFLEEQRVTFGIDMEKIKQIVSGDAANLMFPVVIANGLPVEQGKDGEITYVCTQNEIVKQEERRNFRDVKKIPSLNKGEQIALLSDPTLGQNGRNVFNEEVLAKAGKPIQIRAGRNVLYHKKNKSFYATIDGQLSIGNKVIHIFDTYELNADVSLQTGNLKFVGSIVIRGNVPTGYRVEAEGDIYVYGLVEGAYLEAQGNVYVSEGIAGLGKGTIISKGDVTIGYANQAAIDAGKDIMVKHSIMHSNCVAKEHIYCGSGNIIGGSCSAGQSIEVKNVGNKMYTKTEIAIGINQKDYELENALKKEKQALTDNIDKLHAIGNRLHEKEKTPDGLMPKERILLLKQRKSLHQMKEKVRAIDLELQSLQVELGDEEHIRLIVKGDIYPNTELRFSKYKKTINTLHKFIQIHLKDGEITTNSL